MQCPHCQKALGADHFCVQMLQGITGHRVGRRVLMIGENERALAKAIVAHSATHLHRPGEPGSGTPGDDSRHVLVVPVNIRCVYSRTVLPVDGRTYRYLSISLLDAPENSAAPEIVVAIARELFDFTGLLSDWHISLPETPQPPQIVAVFQLVSPPRGIA